MKKLLVLVLTALLLCLPLGAMAAREVTVLKELDVPLMDNEYAAVRCTGICCIDGKYVYLQLDTVNRTDEPLTLRNDAYIIDGVMRAEGYVYLNAGAHEENLLLLREGSTLPTVIELPLRVTLEYYDEALAEVRHVIYPQGEENVKYAVWQPAETDVLLFRNEEAAAWMVGALACDGRYTSLQLHLENYTDREITFSMPEAYAEGYVIECTWERTLPAHSIHNAYRTWYECREMPSVLSFVLQASDAQAPEHVLGRAEKSVYPFGEENAVMEEYVPAADHVVLADTPEWLLVNTACKLWEDGNISLDFHLENRSDSRLLWWFDEVKADGDRADMAYSMEVTPPGSRIRLSVSLFEYGSGFAQMPEEFQVTLKGSAGMEPYGTPAISGTFTFSPGVAAADVMMEHHFRLAEEDVVIHDGEKLKVTLGACVTDGGAAYRIPITVENRSGQELVLALENCLVDGRTSDVAWGSILAPGETLTSDIFLTNVRAGLEKISFELKAYDLDMVLCTDVIHDRFDLELSGVN
ncbi:MAG: hypothetical protein IJ343_09935 [Clostridia bacterium]|nr:hypothetical protein [Clostridia bacterium]